MTQEKKSLDRLLESLQERAKELNCLYAVEEALNRPDLTPEQIFDLVVQAIPPGWQYTDVCQAEIEIAGRKSRTAGFTESEWVLQADIVVQDRVLGTVSVYYTQAMPMADEGPFLKEEVKLIRTIADRLSHFVLYHRMKLVVHEWDTARRDLARHETGEWRTVLNLLHQTDRNLYMRISHKMLNHLCRIGIKEAENLLERASPHNVENREELAEDSNRPHRRQPFSFPIELSGEVFRIAAANMNDEELVSTIQRWIQDDKLSFLVQVVNRNLPLSEVADAVRRYHHLSSGELDPNSYSYKGVRVSLIRRFLSDQLSYIKVAKRYIDLADLNDLISNVIFTTESHGKLGGKSAGLYLAAQILKRGGDRTRELAQVRVPKTWYVSSDMLLTFMHYNNLDEIVEQKYKPVDQVRFEYPHVVQMFKNSRFPPEMVKGLSVALDDFGETPLIVRSSSLLEDQAGAAFSGKYKSLFLANQGSKQKRLEALFDAIAEVYASTFGPDPIEYRSERGLIDFGEEMGVMIQEVVGQRIGDYFMPAFAGVAFSRNEFRWSPRIKREDGLLRLVPGLGTRAVDRLSDDYPVLIAPGQPGLRVNASTEDIVRYSPKYMDVIDLNENTFVTLPVNELLRKHGFEFPILNRLVSVYADNHMRKPMGSNVDPDEDDLIITFEGLIQDTTFVKEMRCVLSVLAEDLGMPVDVEFAHDGRNLYLLQCRAQSSADQEQGAPIPKEVDESRVVFSARKYVSNGRVPPISHIVYVDPDKYAQITSREEMLTVGRAVSHLNKVLPKHQFILIGPGRWGSRGDIKLGVSVTYSDINNTAMLIEVARQRGNYTPDLSFGTHFFQDLVEARIRYLPLYPDDQGVIFNERFLTRSPNILAEVAPQYAELSEVIRLIDVPGCTNGLVLKVLMNADLGEALGLLGHPDGDVVETAVGESIHQHTEVSWRWRCRMAEQIAAHIDPQRFGVKGVYVFGSTKNATAGPASDIDLLVHVNGSHSQQNELMDWLEGWSVCLDEINYLRTGYRSGGLLDVHLVTDDDIRNKTSYAAKIGAITDPAKALPVGGHHRKRSQ